MTKYRLVDHLTSGGQVAVRIVDRPDRRNNLSSSGVRRFGADVQRLGRRPHGGNPGCERAGVRGQPRVEVTRNGLAVHVHDQVAIIGHS